MIDPIFNYSTRAIQILKKHGRVSPIVLGLIAIKIYLIVKYDNTVHRTTKNSYSPVCHRLLCVSGWVTILLAEQEENCHDKGSYHKRQISNPPTPLPLMFKTAKFQIRQRRYQPNLT